MTEPTLNRRTLLGAAAAAGTGALLPTSARGAVPARDLAAIRRAVVAGKDASVTRLQEWIRHPGIAAEKWRMDESCDFTMGLLVPPSKPSRPSNPDEKYTFLAADTAEIHAQAREFLGPFAVEAKGKMLRLRTNVQGPGLTLTLVDKGTGDLWMQSYLQGQPLTAPPGPTMPFGTAPAGDSQRGTAVGQGSYYVVVENAQHALAPLGIPLPLVGDQTSLVTYSADLGEVP